MSMSNTNKRVKEIRRKARRKFSSEEKIRIVLDGLRGESSIAELCRREGINSNLYYRWSDVYRIRKVGHYPTGGGLRVIHTQDLGRDQCESRFYRWYRAYERDGPDGLHNHSRASRQHWNRIPDSVRELVVDVALEQPELTPRELAWHLTDSPVPAFKNWFLSFIVTL